MKVRFEAVPGLGEPELVLRCDPGDPAAVRLTARLRDLELQESGTLIGRLDGQAYLLDCSRVLYADTVDSRTFLYTREAVYESDLRLYELEERLRGRDFFRASRSAVVNLRAVESLRPDLGGRLRLTMQGGEAVYVSRQYAPLLKQWLGL